MEHFENRIDVARDSSRSPANRRGHSTPRIVELLERTAAGDATAFASLHAVTSTWFRGICVQVLSEQADVEDVMQNIYASLWTGALRFDRGGAECLGWLATVARNRAVDRLRRLRRTQANLSMDGIDAFEDPGLSPPDHAESEARRALLHARLAQLDARSRRLIRGTFFGAQTHAQLAASESLPLGSVKSIIRRGLMQLRTRLACDLA
ncbi:MAG: sigma-70 family RNA polymerase sigma factor [Rudaea sp.]